MDTLSRDSSSSSNNIIPMVALALGGFGLILGIVDLVKANKIEKIVATHTDELAKLPAIEAKADGAATKAELTGLSSGVQNALNQVGTEIGAIRAQITKLEEAAKKAPAAAKGKAGVATGTVDANGNYTIASGDSIRKIAAKFGTTQDALEAENPGLDPLKLQIGKKIKIPRK